MIFKIEGGPKAILLRAAGGLPAPEQYMPVIRSALRLSPLSRCTEVAARLRELRSHVEASGDDGVVDGVPLADFTRPLARLVDAGEDDTWADAFDALDALVAMAATKPATFTEEIPFPLTRIRRAPCHALS